MHVHVAIPTFVSVQFVGEVFRGLFEKHCSCQLGRSLSVLCPHAHSSYLFGRSRPLLICRLARPLRDRLIGTLCRTTAAATWLSRMSLHLPSVATAQHWAFVSMFARQVLCLGGTVHRHRIFRSLCFRETQTSRRHPVVLWWSGRQYGYCEIHGAWLCTLRRTCLPPGHAKVHRG